VKVDETTQAAIALGNIARLEVFDRRAIETAAGHPVVQYRGSLLPLLDLAATIGTGADTSSSDEMSVVVYADERRSVGLVIERVVDIVEDRLTEYEAPPRFGVARATVVKGRVTDVLDVAALVDAMPSTFAELARADNAPGSSEQQVVNAV
jgi:two-component system chemotaxis sensor kinase CheA